MTSSRQPTLVARARSLKCATRLNKGEPCGLGLPQCDVNLACSVARGKCESLAQPAPMTAVPLPDTTLPSVNNKDARLAAGIVVSLVVLIVVVGVACFLTRRRPSSVVAVA